MAEGELVRVLAGRIAGSVEAVVGSLRNGRAVTERLDSGWLAVGEAVSEIARTARRATVLAVNAAIEAAYVDGSGTGFGIVAERMRALATSTADAAADVHAIVAETRGRSVAVFGAIDASLVSLERIVELTAARGDAGGAVEDASAAFLLAGDEARTCRVHGDGVVDGIVSMHQATDRAGAIVEAVAEIGAESQLLAINAAIEAARAGERGRGFTVIADEIGRLAAQTRRATDAITESIEKLRVRGERLARASDDGSREMDVMLREIAAARDSIEALRGTAAA
jgi:methyl-accepting chemotaxis protein